MRGVLDEKLLSRNISSKCFELKTTSNLCPTLFPKSKCQRLDGSLSRLILMHGRTNETMTMLDLKFPRENQGQRGGIAFQIPHLVGV